MDAAAFSAEMVTLVRDFLEEEIDPLRQRVAELEVLLAKKVEGPVVTPAEMQDRIASAIAAMPPQEANEFDPEPMRQIAQETVSSAMAAIPVADKGVDTNEVRTLIQEAIAALPEPKGFDVEEVRPLLKAEAEAAVAAIPAPKNGEPGKNGVTLQELLPVIDEAVTKAVTLIPRPNDGKPGLDAVKFLRGDKGQLMVTMSNGTVEDLGQIDGRDGTDVDMAAVERSIAERVAAIPKPRDGVDGVGFDDLDLVVTEDGVIARFVRGEIVKEIRLPVPVYQGVFKEGRTYRPGDSVTYGGSLWISNAETTEKPDSGKGWQLSVKRGRDGKDGEMKPPRDPKPVKVG